MRGSSALRTSVAPGGALAGPWVRDPLWNAAQAVPSLDMRFAGNKSLADAVTGSNPVTFTRASSGTLVGSDGVLRTAVTNLLLRSEEFGDTLWTKTNATITPDNIASPTGSVAADKLVETSATGVHRAFNNTVAILANTTYTLSVYAKAGERSRLQLDLRDSLGVISAATFNLADGTFISNTGTAHTITPLQNGWYRLAISATTAVSHTTAGTYVFAMSDGTSTSYAGDGTSGLFLWGAQLEQSSTVGEYIPTTSTINSAPRFDHNPTTGESLGLLVEEQRTNSVTNNTMVGAVAGTPGTNPTGWVYATAQSNGLTVSIVGTGVENGINYIDYRFNGTTVASPSACAIGIVNASAATAQTWTASTYWKLAAGSTTGVIAWQLGLIESTAGGAFVAGAFYTQTAPTSAALITQRPAATRTLSGGGTVGQVTLPINVPVTGNTAIDFTLRIGLPQLEQGAFATSVIPTTTTALTRSADVASITGANFSSWYRQDEGTVFIEGITAPALSRFAPELALSDGGDTNKIEMYNYTGGYGATVRKAGETNADPILPLSPVSGAAYKKTLAIKVGDYKIAAQGQQGATTNPLFIPSVSELKIGTNAIRSSSISSTIKRLAYWPARLPNSTLQVLTQ